MAYISRDPFARRELHRMSVEVGYKTCDWCGQLRYRSGKVSSKLFVYKTECDSGRVLEHKGLFCSKSCHDSYHS